MSLKMIHAVHDSRLEPRLRFLAVTLALYANDDGQEIYPGVATLTKALGINESGVREGLQALVESQILVRDGFRHHTRQFKFDLDRLARYQPAAVTRAAWRGSVRRRPRRAPTSASTPQPYATAKGSKDAQPYAMAKGSDAATLRQGGSNPTPRRIQPYAMAVSTLRHGDLHKKKESQESQDSQERTAADAAASAKHAEEKTKERNGTDDGNGRIPFKVYAAIADQAITRSLRDDHSDDLGNITEHFKRLCAAQGTPYSPDLTRRAIDAAWRAREKERRRFMEKARALARVKGMP